MKPRWSNDKVRRLPWADWGYISYSRHPAENGWGASEMLSIHTHIVDEVKPETESIWELEIWVVDNIVMSGELAPSQDIEAEIHGYVDLTDDESNNLSTATNIYIECKSASTTTDHLLTNIMTVPFNNERP